MSGNYKSRVGPMDATIHAICDSLIKDLSGKCGVNNYIEALLTVKVGTLEDYLDYAQQTEEAKKYERAESKRLYAYVKADVIKSIERYLKMKNALVKKQQRAINDFNPDPREFRESAKLCKNIPEHARKLKTSIKAVSKYRREHPNWRGKE